MFNFIPKFIKIVDDKKEEQARQALDANDAEMDRGQTNKSKTVANIGRSNPGYNPFNEHEITRNNWIVSSGGSTNGAATKARSYFPIFHQKPNRNRPHHANKQNRNFRRRYYHKINNNKNFRRHSNK